MEIDQTQIDDTFAEAFDMSFARLIVTADDMHWLQTAVQEFTGYASSVISCDAEAGLEKWIDAAQTPDGRPGAALLVFGFSASGLGSAIPNRVGQCLMTCPTTAVFDGLPDARERIMLGKKIRFFGDGYQRSKLVDDKRFWRIPVMDGEFLVEESVGVGEGVGGGNVILQAASREAGLAAARRSVEALDGMDELITPFPGGIARSGSKVGSRYKGLPASTADAYCPTLRGRVESRLHKDAQVAYEVVIDGTSAVVVGEAMAEAARAAAGDDVLLIGAGNYGGKLGKHHFQLHQLLSQAD